MTTEAKLQIGARVRLPRRLGRASYGTITEINRQGRTWVYYIEASYRTARGTASRHTYYPVKVLEACNDH